MKTKSFTFLSTLIGMISFSVAFDAETINFTQTISHSHFSLPHVYKVYAWNGVEHDLDHVIATVSSFVIDEKGNYRFAQNKEYPITLHAQDDVTTDQLTNFQTAALGIALEMVGSEPNLGGSCRPRKRITPLNQFIFDFGENLSPSALELVLDTKLTGDLGVELKVSLKDGGERAYQVKSDLKDLTLFDSQHASITTFLSSATANSAFNVYWESLLNEKKISPL